MLNVELCCSNCFTMTTDHTSGSEVLILSPCMFFISSFNAYINTFISINGRYDTI